MTLQIKICGITTPRDAEAAALAGADYVGVLMSDSPRRVMLDQARDIVRLLHGMCKCVGVFVDEPLDYVKYAADYCGFELVQFQGGESPAYCRRSPVACMKGIHLRAPLRAGDVAAYDVQALLFDTYVPGEAGGTGRAFNWAWLGGRDMHCPFFLAGGLDPDNIGDAIMATRPDGVDVSSGVASSARIKDHARMRAFVSNARTAWQAMEKPVQAAPQGGARDSRFNQGV